MIEKEEKDMKDLLNIKETMSSNEILNEITEKYKLNIICHE